MSCRLIKKYNLLTKPMLNHVNIGTGEDVSISELAQLIAKVVGYDGMIIYDVEKPDGPKQKLLDTSLINSLGWKAETKLNEGLNITYQDYLTNKNRII